MYGILSLSVFQMLKDYPVKLGGYLHKRASTSLSALLDKSSFLRVSARLAYY